MTLCNKTQLMLPNSIRVPNDIYVHEVCIHHVGMCTVNHTVGDFNCRCCGIRSDSSLCRCCQQFDSTTARVEPPLNIPIKEVHKVVKQNTVANKNVSKTIWKDVHVEDLMPKKGDSIPLPNRPFIRKMVQKRKIK